MVKLEKSDSRKTLLANYMQHLRNARFRHQIGICEYSGRCDDENYCPCAHSLDELKEWNERHQYMMNKVLLAQNEGLLIPSQGASCLVTY